MRLATVPIPGEPQLEAEAQPLQLVVCSGSSQAVAPSMRTTRAMPSTVCAEDEVGFMVID
jgi:hypothetical protein